MKQLLATLTILSLSLFCPPTWAETPKTPVQIEADQMLSSQKDNTVFFSGKVEAKQEGLTIHSDEMMVHYSSNSAPTKQPPKDQKKDGTAQSPLDGGIERLVAKGHVEITKEGWVATGNQAEYFSKERKVVLTGNTKVWQNNNLVTGDTFTIYLDEGKSIVERNTKKGERVKAFFYPDSEKR
ncbi:MAG: LptA/OstA family protein [Desulfobulbaceae bacterium]|nr:LptA/OstA family protein [Desulfobulbaceae bacterium]